MERPLEKKGLGIAAACAQLFDDAALFVVEHLTIRLVEGGWNIVERAAPIFAQARQTPFKSEYLRCRIVGAALFEAAHERRQSCAQFGALFRLERAVEQCFDLAHQFFEFDANIDGCRGLRCGPTAAQQDAKGNHPQRCLIWW